MTFCAWRHPAPLIKAKPGSFPRPATATPFSHQKHHTSMSLELPSPTKSSHSSLSLLPFLLSLLLSFLPSQLTNCHSLLPDPPPHPPIGGLAVLFSVKPINRRRPSRNSSRAFRSRESEASQDQGWQPAFSLQKGEPFRGAGRPLVGPSSRQLHRHNNLFIQSGRCRPPRRKKVERIMSDSVLIIQQHRGNLLSSLTLQNGFLRRQTE